MPTLNPKPPDWIPSASVRIEHVAFIAASADTVWQHFADDAGWVDWFPGFRECRYLSNPPHGRGSKRFVHQDQFRVTEEITAWEPGKHWAMTVVEINAPIMSAMAEEVHFTSENGGTRIDFSIGVELAGIGRLLRRPLQAKSAKGLQTALENLADLHSS